MIVAFRIGEDINKQDDSGNTALHYAVITNRMPVVDWLVTNGAKLNKLNADNKTVLYIATERGLSPIVEKLVRKGADPQTKVGETTLTLMNRSKINSKANAFKIYSGIFLQI